MSRLLNIASSRFLFILGWLACFAVMRAQAALSVEQIRALKQQRAHAQEQKRQADSDAAAAQALIAEAHDKHNSAAEQVAQQALATAQKSGQLANATIAETTETLNAEQLGLEKRQTELDSAITMDVRAINDLGFKRRAQDFDEWAAAATAARDEYRKKTGELLRDLIADKVRDNGMEIFRHLDAEKAARWTAYLRTLRPRPDDLIAAIEGVGNLQSKGKAVYDAKFIVAGIEDSSKAWKVQDLNTALPVMLGLVCEPVSAMAALSRNCKFFSADAEFMAEGLYNNATRRVAVHEVDQLTTMTEKQLAGLRRINEVLTQHVKERNDVRTALREFE